EIAAIGAALGASYGGHLGMTTTSGPGLALKTEMMGLALMAELPLVVVNVQRGGPSTGLPTKPEQADLLQAMYGRHGESPVPVIAAKSPSDCFDAAIEATRIAVTYRTPVLLLTDGFLANGTEPWLIPDVSKLPSIEPDQLQTFNAVDENGEPVLMPFARDPETLARPWITPGTKNLMHRIGGLEKADGTGNVSYDYENHEHMINLRAQKIAGIKVADAELEGDAEADTVVVGWGSTWGAIDAAIAIAGRDGFRAAHVHLRHINPFPANLGELLARFDHVIVPEMNKGQLSKLLRAEFLVDAKTISNTRGQPFNAHLLAQQIGQLGGSR
ncbi:MAG: 2-oxoglutarate ferredoxin oxidoreductase subunit alpha, partial [Acidimicrobiales bacterium]